MQVVGWVMIAMLFAGIAWLMWEEMPVRALVGTFAAAFTVTGWIWVAVNFITKNGQ